MINKGTNSAAQHAQSVADIIKQRSGTHGDALDNLNDIGRRWSNYINKKFPDGGEVKLEALDVSYLMVEMKLSRATYGDNAEMDHYKDMIGYAAIACASIDKAKEVTILNVGDGDKNAVTIPSFTNSKPSGINHDNGCC